MMKLAILFSVFIFNNVFAEFCHKDDTLCCRNSISSHCSAAGDSEPANCNAIFSAAHTVMTDFENVVRQHLSHSFQYLLMSANFGNYQKNREGFSKLYRKLSDRSWDDAIDTIKYMTKRGGKMNFFGRVISTDVVSANNFTMYELESLSRALDMSKSMASNIHHIHGQVTKRDNKYHDADVLNFLEDKFVEKHSQTIRDLSGHTNDLLGLIKGGGTDASLSIFLFDEYLKSLY